VTPDHVPSFRYAIDTSAKSFCNSSATDDPSKKLPVFQPSGRSPSSERRSRGSFRALSRLSIATADSPGSLPSSPVSPTAASDNGHLRILRQLQDGLPRTAAQYPPPESVPEACKRTTSLDPDLLSTGSHSFGAHNELLGGLDLTLDDCERKIRGGSSMIALLTTKQSSDNNNSRPQPSSMPSPRVQMGHGVSGACNMMEARSLADFATHNAASQCGNDKHGRPSGELSVSHSM